MINSIYSQAFSKVLKDARNSEEKDILIGNSIVKIKKPFPSPEDWRDLTIYFILNDRFNNSDSEPKSKWDEKYNGFQGGTFNGIRDKLDYIKSLGFSALWLSPVFKNCAFDNTYHGYGIQDFLSVDPRLGTEEELQNLIDQAHARGIYIILDIVLNHTGEVFKYDLGNGNIVDEPALSDHPSNILWRDKNGKGKWSVPPKKCNHDASVWPVELRNRNYFFRLGNGNAEDNNSGDFFTLRKINIDFIDKDRFYPVRDILIKSYQYAIAKFDCDGFRIDTLKYISNDFAHVFGNAIREFSQSIGKKNFFTFGEVYDTELKINQYIGRNTQDMNGIIGVDAALDYPLFYVLPMVIKGILPPLEIVRVFLKRKEIQKNFLSSHADAGRYFVSFIDNHDQAQRFYSKGYQEQLKMAIGALITLQGIACIYYGTEQGLSGSGGMDNVREALWGKPNAFDTTSPIYKSMKALNTLHSDEAALRYGRQYFREISGDGINYGISSYQGGVLAYSRILYDEEVLVVINTSTENSWSGYVIIDYILNFKVSKLRLLYSNYNKKITAVVSTKDNTITCKFDGSKFMGKVCTVSLNLKPMEIQILKK